MEIIFTFNNTHFAISAEHVLSSADIAVKIRPVPNAITAGCGFCLCISVADCLRAQTALKNAGIIVSATYRMEDGVYAPYYEIDKQ